MLLAIATGLWLMPHRNLLERYRECNSTQQVTQVQDEILAELKEDVIRRKESLTDYGQDLLVTNPNHSVTGDGSNTTNADPFQRGDEQQYCLEELV